MLGARLTARLQRVLLAGALLVACDGNGPRSDIQIEYACPIGESCPGVAPPGACLAVYASVGEGDQRRPVALFEPDPTAQVDGGYAEIRAASGEAFTFDVPRDRFMMEGSPDLPLTLEFRYYAGMSELPTLGATIENVTPELLDSESLSVRLYPIRRWAVPGGGEVAPRAFHAAIPLPNGDVFIFGGVRGLVHGIDPTSDGLQAPLEYTMGYYDESAHTFIDVASEGVPQEQLGRALFGYRYLGQAQGRHTIRLFGGLTVETVGARALTFDGRGANTIGGSPIRPGSDAMVAPTVDLILDTSDESQPRVVELRPVPPSGEPNGGAVVVSGPQATLSADGSVNDVSGVVYPEMIGIDAGNFAAPVQAYTIDSAGAASPPYNLGHTRIGSSATRLASGSTFVFGGNVQDAVGTPEELEDPNQFAGELHAGASATITPVFQPTAFHTAALAGPGTVLLTGGFAVEAVSTMGPITTGLTPPASPLRLIEVSEAPASASIRSDLPTNGYQTTIFHTLTPLGDGRFLIVGGSTLNAIDMLSRLTATNQTGVVSGIGYQPGDDEINESRFGHTATRLPGNRILVLGGFSSDEAGSQLNIGPQPEILYYVDVDPDDVLAADACESRVRRRDAGPRQDAALPPAMDAGFDAGAPDAGPPIPDAGPDAGMPDAG